MYLSVDGMLDGGDSGWTEDVVRRGTGPRRMDEVGYSFDEFVRAFLVLSSVDTDEVQGQRLDGTTSSTRQRIELLSTPPALAGTSWSYTWSTFLTPSISTSLHFFRTSLPLRPRVTLTRTLRPRSLATSLPRRSPIRSNSNSRRSQRHNHANLHPRYISLRPTLHSWRMSFHSYRILLGTDGGSFFECHLWNRGTSGIYCYCWG